MITNDEKWQYLAAKSLSALLRGIKSKYDRGFHYLNCFHSYCTKCKLKKHKVVCENHNYCYTEMSKVDNKVLKHNHGEKSMKVLCIIYTDLESLLEKIKLSIIILRNHQ